jgi:hypothetical protein
MAFYLVRAHLKPELYDELKRRLENREFAELRPFGPTLHQSLLQARVEPETLAIVWEEECYCQPPLAQERAMVLDQYFDQLRVERVAGGQGWQRINGLPRLWVDLTSG